MKNPHNTLVNVLKGNLLVIWRGEGTRGKRVGWRGGGEAVCVSNSGCLVFNRVSGRSVSSLPSPPAPSPARPAPAALLGLEFLSKPPSPCCDSSDIVY